eukprot:scaffold11250_cov101-Isochrysis_galbana.AAC.1
MRPRGTADRPAASTTQHLTRTTPTSGQRHAQCTTVTHHAPPDSRQPATACPQSAATPASALTRPPPPWTHERSTLHRKQRRQPPLVHAQRAESVQEALGGRGHTESQHPLVRRQCGHCRVREQLPLRLILRVDSPNRTHGLEEARSFRPCAAVTTIAVDSFDVAVTADGIVACHRRELRSAPVRNLVQVGAALHSPTAQLVPPLDARAGLVRLSRRRNLRRPLFRFGRLPFQPPAHARNGCVGFAQLRLERAEHLARALKNGLARLAFDPAVCSRQAVPSRDAARAAAASRSESETASGAVPLPSRGSPDAATASFTTPLSTSSSGSSCRSDALADT